MANTIPILTAEAKLKREIRKHFQELGFGKDNNGELVPPGNSKNEIRNLYKLKKEENLIKNKKFIKAEWKKLGNYFANGNEIIPSHISPEIEVVKSDTWQSNLFRLASFTWSVPVSAGFGRRIRFLIWDRSNDKVIGLLALGDPVFNLSVRDNAIGWTIEDRKEKLINLLDAYVLGAIPPYNNLLCGKLIACLIRSEEVKELFGSKYGSKAGIISKRGKNPKLSIVTTTSALGRSSIYNRLKLNKIQYFRPVGYTTGWGHFHLSDRIFCLMRQFLKMKNDPYSCGHSFGDGPNWKIRAAKRALRGIGFNPCILKHGIKREVFLSEIASNAIAFLNGTDDKLKYSDLLSTKDISGLAKERWIVPRSERFDVYKSWNKDQIIDLIDNKLEQLDKASSIYN